MTFSGLALAAFVGVLAFFATYALVAHSKVTSLRTFFHFEGRRRNLISLIVSNVTIGSGLTYLVAAGAENGLLMLAAPVAVIAGYVLLAGFTRRIVHPRLLENGNFLNGAALAITSARDQRSTFALTVSLPLVVVFLLLFAYEVFVASQILSALLWPGAGAAAQIITSLSIFGASLLYSWLGGIQAVFRNDAAQLVGILLFAGALAIAGWGWVESPIGDATTVGFSLKSDWQTLLNIAVAVIAAVATQFYSLLNWYTASNFSDGGERQSVLALGGVCIAVLLAGMVLLGALVPLDWNAGLVGAIGTLFSVNQGTRVVGGLLTVVIVVGLTSVVMSTIDTLMVSLTMYVRKNLLGKETEDTAHDRRALREARLHMTVLFGVAFVFLGMLYFMKPNLFYLLLAIAAGATVFTPLLVLVGFLSRIRGGLVALSNWVLAIYGLLFVLTIASSLWATFTQETFVPHVSLAGLAVSTTLSLIVYAVAIRHKSTPLSITN